MALSKTDKVWIDEQINNALRGSGWRRFVVIARDWSIPGIALAAIIGLLTLVLPEWKQYTEFRVRSEDRLESIEAKLLNLAPSASARTTLGEIQTLQPNALAIALPALRQVSRETAEASGADQATIAGIGRNLRRVSQYTPGYWPTVMQYIGFASAGISSGAVPAETAPVNVHLSNNHGFMPLGPFRNCVALLDGGDVGPATFQNCRVRFTDNPVRMRGVVFISCVFEFPETDDPSPFLKHIGGRILEAGVQSPISISDL